MWKANRMLWLSYWSLLLVVVSLPSLEACFINSWRFFCGKPEVNDQIEGSRHLAVDRAGSTARGEADQ